jgi:hypothetical protein
LKKPITIAIHNGKMSFIYDDQLADLISEGDSKIERVSNVEPAEGGWVAFMNDGTKLGPFKLRQEALDAEIAYIQERLGL